MSKPLSEFGGWLRFFLALWWGHLILACLQLVNITFYLMEGIPADLTQFLLILMLVSIQWSIPIIFATWVIRTVKVRSTETPNKVVKILCQYFVVFFLVWAFVPRVACFAKLTPPDTTYYANLFQNLVIAAVILGGYSAIWFLYFKKSKRVFAYYGKNAK